MTVSWCVPGTATRSEAAHPDFKVRHGLDAPRLTELFGWTEAAIPRAHERFGHQPLGLRALAAQYRRGARQCSQPAPEVLAALETRRADPSLLVREHVLWALAQHGQALSARPPLADRHAQIVDEARVAEARRGEHHELATRLAGQLQFAAVADRKIVRSQSGLRERLPASALNRQEIAVAGGKPPARRLQGRVDGRRHAPFLRRQEAIARTQGQSVRRRARSVHR